MPQFIDFPQMPAAGAEALFACFADMPAGGEPFKAFRRRLKAHGLWSRERLTPLLRFLQMSAGDVVVPSRFARALGGEDAKKALADRLWVINPILLATVYERLTERVHSNNELLKYMDSFAYPGARLSGPNLRAWLRLADGAGLFKAIGISLGLSDDAVSWFAKRVERFDLEEFLEDDQDEEEPAAASGAAIDEGADDSDSAPVEAEPVALAPPPPAAVGDVPARPAPASTTSWAPVLPAGPFSPADFATTGCFAEPVRQSVADRLDAWWTNQPDDDRSAPVSAAALGISADAFRDDPNTALFELGVAASVRFGAADPAAVMLDLRTSGVLNALSVGLPPSGPVRVDAGALMSASLVARRIAEHPDLASDIEQADDADAVFELLRGAFDGLLTIELFWMVRALAAMGAIRRTGASAYGALPTRTLRNMLFRQGFLTSPYAPDMASLQAAARAAAPLGPRAEHRASAFTRASDCQFDCPHRAACTVPCRERSDRS